MCAGSKEFALGEDHISWLLGNVHITTEHEFHWVPLDNIIEPIVLTSKVIQDLNEKEKNLIYAIQLRKAFGGMKCDAELLEAASRTLLKLAKGSGKIPDKLSHSMDQEIISAILGAIQPLKIGKWEPAAVDFHVSDIVTRWHNILPMDDKRLWSKEDLQTCMWEACSSRNFRRSLVSPSLWIAEPPAVSIRSSQIWMKYGRDVEHLARKILREKQKRTLNNKIE